MSVYLLSIYLSTVSTLSIHLSKWHINLEYLSVFHWHVLVSPTPPPPIFVVLKYANSHCIPYFQKETSIFGVYLPCLVFHTFQGIVHACPTNSSFTSSVAIASGNRTIFLHAVRVIPPYPQIDLLGFLAICESFTNKLQRFWGKTNPEIRS